MAYIGDAPDIARAIRTGYPAIVGAETECEVCGAVVRGWLYEIEGIERCTDCFKDWLDDFFNTNPELIADALNVGRRKA
jgi:hypothetical protein